MQALAGANASTFTSAAAWRRAQWLSATGVVSTVTAKRPSSVMWIVAMGPL